MMFDADTRKGVVHGNADVLSVIGPASIEFVMMLSFNETGEKVVRIDEFFDSAVYSSFFMKLQEFVNQGGDKTTG